YITTESVQENLIISPSIKNTPLVDARLNMLRIRINDTLDKNTTYSIKFGNAIKDVNEGNILKDFTYVFSTGNYLDSGKLSGNVRIAETGAIDSTLIVVLHPNGKDSSIYKDKPMYYAKVNSKGKFAFTFLPTTTFSVYVLPNDYNKKYDDRTKLFGFLNEPLQITTQTDSQQLYVFQAYPKIEKKRTSAAANNKNVKKVVTGLKYSKSLDGSQQDLLTDFTLSFESPVQLNDSFPIQLCDTLNKPLENFTVTIDSATKKMVNIHYEWMESTHMHLIVPKKSIIDTNQNFIAKADTIKFITKSDADYGSALLRISGYQNRLNPILLLTKDNIVKYSYPIKQSLIQILKLPPGDYDLKVLEDTNNNGIWDTGKYNKTIKQQPEIVRTLNDVLNIKANWENELNIIINK
ncbi:MAG: Ig-like domain-containing protein, partial [Sediminibacterium sp.]